MLDHGGSLYAAFPSNIAWGSNWTPRDEVYGGLRCLPSFPCPSTEGYGGEFVSLPAYKQRSTLLKGGETRRCLSPSVVSPR